MSINISYILASRSPPGQLNDMLKSMSEKAKDPTQIEVIVKIDRDDYETIHYLESNEWHEYNMPIRYIITDQGKGWFSIGSQVWNQLLFCTNPETYFIMFGKDDLRFKLQDWDEKLLAYKHHWPDDVFYIRTSEFKDEKYKDDFFRMITRPDNYSVYTKKLLHLAEGIGDYWAQDSWLQPILSTMHDCYNLDRGIVLSEDLYDWESMQPCDKDPDKAAEITQAFYRLTQPLYVKYTYFRLAKQIYEYIESKKPA